MAAKGPTRLFIIDSSSWVDMDGHPHSNRIPEMLDKLHSQGSIRVPRQVFEELERSGPFSGWAKANRRTITYSTRNPDYFANAGLVQYEFPGLGRATGARDRADPWVVAAALTEAAKGVEVYVVCAETRANRPNRKIPGVCDQLGLKWKTLAQMIEDEDAE